jgi:hypothetical protein
VSADAFAATSHPIAAQSATSNICYGSNSRSLERNDMPVEPSCYGGTRRFHCCERDADARERVCLPNNGYGDAFERGLHLGGVHIHFLQRGQTMQQDQQRQLDALRRVQDFLDTHADRVGALKESEGRQQLDDTVEQLATHGDDQGTSDLEMAGQIKREKSLISDLRAQHMQPIATFARAKLRGVPDFAALTKSGSKMRPKQLVQSARAMATAAAPHADALTRGGFPSDTIAQLGAAAKSLEDAITERANTKVRRIGATKGIHVELAKGREAVTMLNAVVSKQFARDKTFLAAWRAAYRVLAKAGVVRVSSVAATSLATAPVGAMAAGV